jgi:hypothetical protein
MERQALERPSRGKQEPLAGDAAKREQGFRLGSDSIPSAIVSMPSVSPRLTTARASSGPSPSVTRRRTNERSIFSTSIGKRCR